MSRVLVADDNVLNLRLVCEVLTFAGYEVIQAESGRQAVDRAFSERPELILMDLRMPEMNGEEAMHILKNDARTRDIPIVVLTASAMAGELEHLMGQGFDGYIDKPIDVATFATTVGNFIRG